MARPQTMACYSMGTWFCKAMSIRDPELARSEGFSTKKLLIEKGYVEIPDLINKLKAYNYTHEEK